jgi:DNA-binding MarR family transcriptional regulator
MTTPFGPQLIGETEKTLNALLLRHLDALGADGGLTEPQWVTLRVANMLDGTVDRVGLAAAVTERAHFADALQHIDDLSVRGLLDDGRLTADGRDTLTRVQTSLADDTSALFDDLVSDDVAATTRVLNDVLDRAHVLLAR